MKKNESVGAAKDSKEAEEGKIPIEKMVTIGDSPVHDLPKVSLDKEVGDLNVEGEKKKNVIPPLKIDPLSEDFSYLDKDDTSMFGLLGMARAGAIGTFKLSKWTLQ